MYGSLQSIAAHVGRADPVYAQGAAYVTGLDLLPRERVINDARVTDHHAIVPTDDRHDLKALASDERRIYDMVARRFLAIFHPPARFEQTIVFTEAGGEQFRSQGRVLIEAGWRSVYGEVEAAAKRDDEDEGEQQQSLPALSRSSPCAAPRSTCWRSRPSRRRATPSRACCGPWRRPASWSRTTRPRRP